MSELVCQRCGGPNIWSWSVDSDRFNAAMEALGLDAEAIVCPVCFVEGHEKATGLRTTWRLEVSKQGGFHHIGSIEGENLSWHREVPWSKRAVVSARNRIGTPTTTDELRAFVMECVEQAKRIDVIERDGS